MQTSVTEYDGIGTISLDVLQLADDALDFDDALDIKSPDVMNSKTNNSLSLYTSVKLCSYCSLLVTQKVTISFLSSKNTTLCIDYGPLRCTNLLYMILVSTDGFDCSVLWEPPLYKRSKNLL